MSLGEHDRRRAARSRKLLRLSFEWGDKRVTAVATDINHLGVFVNSQIVPPVGARVTLRYTSDDSKRTVVMESQVVRVVHQTLRASRIPGMACEFERVVAPGGRADLDWFASTVLSKSLDDLSDAALSSTPDGFAMEMRPSNHAALRVHEERLKEGKHLPVDAQTEAENAKNIGRERRRNPRFAVRVDLSFYVGDIPYLGSVLNISQSSLFMQTDHDIPPVGTNVSLKYPLAEAPDPQYVRIDGTVCRHWNRESEGLPGYAIHFDHVGELGRRGIFQMYLNNFRKRGSKRRGRGFHYSMTRR